jgi:DNA-binding FadR family transcriptional regulator
LTFNPMRVQRPREQVEVQIREAILSGHFRQGDKLPSETALADKFSVSRTTVREALRSLASAGLIAKVPGVTGGSFVQTVDHRSLGSSLGDSLQNIIRLGSVTRREVRDLRRLLEVPAAGLAAEHRTDEHLETLARIIAREKGTTVEDPEVPDLDISFHSAVAEATGNRPLAAFISALHQVTRPVAGMPLSPEVGRKTVRQHVAIVKAIREGDADAAGKAMTAHLDYLQGLEAERAAAA